MAKVERGDPFPGLRRPGVSRRFVDQAVTDSETVTASVTDKEGVTHRVDRIHETAADRQRAYRERERRKLADLRRAREESP
jgi:hypothetical protein